MTAHELANLLLQGPNNEVVVEGDGCYNRTISGIESRLLEDDTTVVFLTSDEDDRNICEEDDDE